MTVRVVTIAVDSDGPFGTVYVEQDGEGHVVLQWLDGTEYVFEHDQINSLIGQIDQTAGVWFKINDVTNESLTIRVAKGRIRARTVNGDRIRGSVSWHELRGALLRLIGRWTVRVDWLS